MILDIITTILGVGKGWLEGKQRIKEVKVEAEAKVIVARAEAEIVRLDKGLDAEISWDNAAVSQMPSSWKDEWFALLLSVPLILAFLGDWGRTAVSQGFEAIALAPDWYKVAFLTAIAASYGVRALVDRFGFGKK